MRATADVESLVSSKLAELLLAIIAIIPTMTTIIFGAIAAKHKHELDEKLALEAAKAHARGVEAEQRSVVLTELTERLAALEASVAAHHRMANDALIPRLDNIERKLPP